MFGLGLPEMGIIAVIALLIFGPKKIPEMGRALGKTLRGFKEEMSQLGNEEESSQTETPEDKTKAS
jgi:sec-independent protein translocase protein TatA